MSGGQRVSRAGLGRLAAELGERDWAIVEMLGTLHMATGNQIRRAQWSQDTPASRRAARRALERLTRWRVLARLDRRMGGLGRGSDSWTYALDVAGQRLRRSGGARRPHLPRPPMWMHALQTAEIYTRLIEGLRGSATTLAEWQGEPDCWCHYAGPYGERLVVKPDAYVRVQGFGYSDTFFVEVDTGSQSRTVIRSKLEAYRRYAASGVEQSQSGVFPQVLLLTTTEARHAFLVDQVGTQPPESWPLFAVGLVSDSADLLLPPAPEVTQ